jgi:predicted MFS family arabinose efflux permease
VTAVGTLVLAGSVAGTGLVTSLWQLYLVYGLLTALGLAATGHVVASAVVSRWFIRRRATALSVLSAASMAGVSLLVPLAMWLILHFGWRGTYGLLGLGIVVLMLPLALWAVRDSPEAIGLAPDGAAAPAADSGRAGDEKTSVTAAVRTASFWQICCALSACGFTMGLISAHGVPMLTDHGYDAMFASWALAVLGGSSVVFVLFLGVIADRIGCRPVLAAVLAGRAVAYSGLFLIRDLPGLLLATAALGGATMAGVLSNTSALTASIFGRHSVGPVFGTMFLIHQTGAALGSGLGGYLFEQTGGYGTAFTISAVVLVVSSLVTLTIDERPGAAIRLSPIAGEG